MKLVPTALPPDEEKAITKSAFIQLIWEKIFLIEKNRRLCKEAWRLIRSKGTASTEYQEVYTENYKVCCRVQEIKAMAERLGR